MIVKEFYRDSGGEKPDLCRSRTGTSILREEVEEVV